MRRTYALLVLTFLLLVVGAADLSWIYPHLPARVATRFGPNGAATTWSSKSGLLATDIILLGLIGVLFPGLRFLCLILPARLFNLPHREYWLAPERSAYTRVVVGDLLLSLGVINLIYAIILMHLVMAANLKPEPSMTGGGWIIMGLYLVATLAVIFPVLRGFKRGGGLRWRR